MHREKRVGMDLMLLWEGTRAVCGPHFLLELYLSLHTVTLLPQIALITSSSSVQTSGTGRGWQCGEKAFETGWLWCRAHCMATSSCCSDRRLQSVPSTPTRLLPRSRDLMSSLVSVSHTHTHRSKINNTIVCCLFFLNHWRASFYSHWKTI